MQNMPQSPSGAFISKALHPASLLALTALLAGIIVRAIWLGQLPAGLHQDESFVAWNALGLFHQGLDSSGRAYPIYMADWGDGHSALYVWLLQPLLWLNRGEIPSWLLRLPQCLTACLSLALAYGLMRSLYAARPGLRRWLPALSLFTLALCPWHIMMSRWGLDANLAPGFLLLACFAMAKALEQPKYLPLAAAAYGISLYAYALLWPIVPFVLLWQVAGGLLEKRFCLNSRLLLSGALLGLMALPLLLFVAVNMGLMPPIELPFLTIPSMGGYRGAEIALTPGRMLANLRQSLYLLYHQQNGSAFDILLPWGLFYDIGRILALLGGLWLSLSLARGLWLWASPARRPFPRGDWFFFSMLAGGGLSCLLVSPVLHQINALYIPLCLCQAYALSNLYQFLSRRFARTAASVLALCLAVYVLSFATFLPAYFGPYQKIVGAYFGQGVEEALDFAMDQARYRGIEAIVAEQAAQWPRLALYSRTLPRQYQGSLIYDKAPHPKYFHTGELGIYTRLNPEDLRQDRIYLLYYTQEEHFRDAYALHAFGHWLVALPR